MDQANLNALAKRLSTALEAADISARELAARLGAHPSYIARVLKGERCPSAEWLQKIGEELNDDPSELLEYIGVKPSSSLPSARKFFHRKYGMPEDEAEILANLVEYQHKMRKQKEDREETDQERHDGPN